MPGMYAVTSTPVVNRTRATLRSAEFGFLGVCVKTRVQTPRRWGEPFSAGVFVFSDLVSRPFRTSWAIVGTRGPSRDFGAGFRGPIRAGPLRGLSAPGGWAPDDAARGARLPKPTVQLTSGRCRRPAGTAGRARPSARGSRPNRSTPEAGPERPEKCEP